MSGEIKLMDFKSSQNIPEFPFRIKTPYFVSDTLEVLRKNGFRAYIVGGAIRDALLNRKAVDWDITTDAEVHEIQSAFKDIRQFSLKHKTVTLVYSEMFLDVTTMKGDEGEKADIFSDLGHRDFTLNAMAYDEEKSIVLDPHGGAFDIKMKKLKAVSNPNDRFIEDPLRILRALRIAGELDFSIDKGTLDSIPCLASALSTVSVERIRDELVKIILCRNASNLLELMCETGIMKYILPELLEGYGMEQNSWHKHTVFDHTVKTVENVPPNHILRIAALLHDIGKPRVKEEINGEYHFYNHQNVSSAMAKEILERLRFGKDEIRKITALISFHMIDYKEGWSDAAVRRLIKRVGQDNIDELLVLRKADIIAHGIMDDKPDLLTHLEQRIAKLREANIAVNITDLAIDGKKVMEVLGLKSGPEVGKILKKMLELIIDNPELNSEEELIDFLKNIRHDPQ